MQIQSYQFEDWDRVLKIESEVLYELVINFIILYISNSIRMLIFTDIEILLGCKFSPINFRTGTEAPVLKIEKGVLNELVINFIVFYVSNCIRILIFTGIDVLIGCKVSLISLRTGNEPPVLKIAFRGILQLGSVSHRFLRLNLHKSGKFHASIKFCTIDVTSDLTNDGCKGLRTVNNASQQILCVCLHPGLSSFGKWDERQTRVHLHEKGMKIK